MRLLTSVGKRRGTRNLFIRFDIRHSEKAANLEDDDVNRMLDAVTFEDIRMMPSVSGASIPAACSRKSSSRSHWNR